MSADNNNLPEADELACEDRGMASQTPPGGSQTLSRGIRILEALAGSDRALSIDELAGALDVHRSVAYRLLRTLEHHGLVARDDAGRARLAAGVATLAYAVSRDLQQAAYPQLVELADELRMTCLIAVLIDGDEAVTLMSASPRSEVAVSYRPGHRHPITRGGPGKAILMGLPSASWPADVASEVAVEIDESRARGYALSESEVVSSLHAVSVPLDLPGQPPASLSAIHINLPRPAPEIAAALDRSARQISESFGARRPPREGF